MDNIAYDRDVTSQSRDNIVYDRDVTSQSRLRIKENPFTSTQDNPFTSLSNIPPTAPVSHPFFERTTSVTFSDSDGPESPRTPDGGKLAAEMATAGRNYGQGLRSRNTRRLIQKNGDCNVVSRHVLKRHRSYLVDIFTTLIDMRWRLHVILFFSASILTWCGFALIWWIIAITHGDDDMSLSNETWKACVENVYDYRTALLFSIETQHTVGYGSRVINDECWISVIILIKQCCVGMVVQSLVTGIIFAKISRPKGRSQTIMFSQKAVICQRDGEYYLLFRVGDMRKSHIIGTSMRALLVQNRFTREGESIPLCQYPLTLEAETSRSDCFIFLIWPITVVHKITETSPLWNMTAETLKRDHFEIIVILEGTVESTGSFTQVRTSYVPNEICWGERLVPLLTFQLENGRYEIDYRNFHSTVPLKMPPHSAREAAEFASTQITPAVFHDRDYPMSFAALNELPRKRPVSEKFNLRHRITASEDQRVYAKRKVASARDRTRADNYKGSTVTLADPTRVPPTMRRPFKSLFQQTINDGTSPSKKFTIFSLRSGSEKSGSTEYPSTADVGVMAVSWDADDGVQNFESNEINSAEDLDEKNSNLTMNEISKSFDLGNEDVEKNEMLDDIEESHQENTPQVEVSASNTDQEIRDQIISTNTAVDGRSKLSNRKKIKRDKNLERRIADSAPNIIVLDQSNL